MSTRYLKASVPRINSIVKQVCNLMERQVATLPPGACFDLSGNLQLCSMVCYRGYDTRGFLIPFGKRVGHDLHIHLWGGFWWSSGSDIFAARQTFRGGP